MFVGKDGDLGCAMLSSVNDYARLSGANLLNVQVKNATIDAKQAGPATISTQAIAPPPSDPTRALQEILSKALVENPAAQNLNSAAGENSRIVNGHYLATPIGLRDLNADPFNIRDKTLAEVEQHFYDDNSRYRMNADTATMEPDYLFWTFGMSAEKAKTFIDAFNSKTLLFTSTADIPGLQYSEHQVLFRDGNGDVVGGGLTVDDITGTENISKVLGTDNFFITSNMGYREKGATTGLIISW
jgi:hypothetical protein